MSNLTCPLCGNEKIDNEPIKKSIKEPFGGSKEVLISNYICSECGFDGDLMKENDQILQESISELKCLAVKNILEEFGENHYNFASIERALELPQRTLSKWKNLTSKPSAAGVALIRYLYLFPWLIDVAENNFDYSQAQKVHIFDAIKKTLDKIDFSPNDFPMSSTTANFEFIKISVRNSSPDDLNDTYDNDFGFVNAIPSTTTAIR